MAVVDAVADVVLHVEHRGDVLRFGGVVRRHFGGVHAAPRHDGFLTAACHHGRHVRVGVVSQLFNFPCSVIVHAGTDFRRVEHDAKLVITRGGVIFLLDGHFVLLHPRGKHVVACTADGDAAVREYRVRLVQNAHILIGVAVLDSVAHDALAFVCIAVIGEINEQPAVVGKDRVREGIGVGLHGVQRLRDGACCLEQSAPRGSAAVPDALAQLKVVAALQLAAVVDGNYRVAIGIDRHCVYFAVIGLAYDFLGGAIIPELSDFIEIVAKGLTFSEVGKYNGSGVIDK